MKNTILRFGLIGGVLLILMSTLFLLDKNPIATIRSFDFLLIPVVVFFSIKEYKLKYNRNFLQFWQGMSVGIGVFSLVAFIASTAIYSYGAWIAPDIVTSYIQEGVSAIEEKKDAIITELGKEDYDLMLFEMNRTTILALALDSLIKKVFIGLMSTIFVSIVLRKTENHEKLAV